MSKIDLSKLSSDELLEISNITDSAALIAVLKEKGIEITEKVANKMITTLFANIKNLSSDELKAVVGGSDCGVHICPKDFCWLDNGYS